jgi:23S rRNA pseudouridine1911/1915/1917 synthase
VKQNSERHLVIAASPSDARVRVDQFLVAKMPQYSRSLITKFIRQGAITTGDGMLVKPAHVVMGGELFHFILPAKTAATMQAEEIPLAIVYSDDHIAVINKPSGLVVHPGAGVQSHTLCNALLHHFPGMSIGNVERPGIVHRLDKDTSGIMVIAKTEQAHRHLSAQFKDRRVEKSYRALCFGEFAATSFDLKTGHARHHHNRLRFSTKLSLEKLNGMNVRLAHTSFRVEKCRFGMSLLTATLHTGRTHQIRAHLADIDHPLLGDDLYGGKRIISERVPEDLRNAIDALQGQALHAETLIFCHPKTLEQLSFTAELPAAFARITEFFV